MEKAVQASCALSSFEKLMTAAVGAYFWCISTSSGHIRRMITAQSGPG